jgi:hypothetical protein
MSRLFLVVSPAEDLDTEDRIELRENPFSWPYVTKTFDVPEEISDQLRNGELILRRIGIQ